MSFRSAKLSSALSQKNCLSTTMRLVFIDNDSTDKTRELLRMLCAKNPKIKAIFNARSFGQFNSPYYGILQVTGDCVISMVADFQGSVEAFQYVHEWENGYKIVIGIKTSNKENPAVMYWLRSCYKLIGNYPAWSRSSTLQAPDSTTDSLSSLKKLKRSDPVPSRDCCGVGL